MSATEAILHARGQLGSFDAWLTELKRYIDRNAPTMSSAEAGREVARQARALVFETGGRLDLVGAQHRVLEADPHLKQAYARS
jgi:hypothetical protein